MRGRGRRPPPTRSNLVRSRRRLDRVEKGKSLLMRKRRALVRELFELAPSALDAREDVAEQAEKAYPALLEGLAARGHDDLQATGWPARPVEVELRSAAVWGIGSAEIVDRPRIRRTPSERGTAPSLSGPAAAVAAAEFEALVELLLDAASREMLIRRLADALSDTTRQLNTLDQRLIPDLQDRIAHTERVLEEREREEHTRIKHLLRRRGRAGPGGGASTRGRVPV